jgi:hypothetical protein
MMNTTNAPAEDVAPGETRRTIHDPATSPSKLARGVGSALTMLVALFMLADAT